ncbi:DUF4253 domain-containing protein [Streptomyces sp. NPDC008079]|uniref:DUF4253 domain-containing protein n=1 Tax=Streptomyces sp. NPDC008079 TaxID=3364806 RepID=UPI0036E0F073
MEAHFYRQPEWIIMTEVAESFMLPTVLDAPAVSNLKNYGDFSRDPYGRHAAVWREWYERYGATVYYVGSSAAVLDVTSPPQAPSERARLAVEQVDYCGDLNQVIGDSFDIAERQAPSHQWFFWWD